MTMRAIGPAVWLLVALALLGSPAQFLRHAEAQPDAHEQHHPDQKAGQKPNAPDAKPDASPTLGGATGIPRPSASPKVGASPEPGEMRGTPSSPASPSARGMGGMMEKMMEGMGKMMEQMGAPAPKELYPTLMDLPNLPPEKRAEIERLAHDRMTASREQMSAAATRLSDAAMREDYAAMEQATSQMREALAQFESGLAAHRALAEGKAPRNVALQWFRQEMNLLPAIRPEEPRAILGLPPFHLFTMVLLIAFALAMVAMYFLKMRRAAALFGRLGPDTNPPPPGSSPPLAGAPGPSAPVVPPAGGAPPPAAPTSSTTPAASATSPGGSSAVPVPSGDAAKIAVRADELWQARGRPMGSPETDWLRAEEEFAKAADKPPASPAGGGLPASPATPPAVLESTSASPVTANWRGQLRIGSIVAETPSVKTFRLLPSSSDSLMPFTFVPGQFLNVTFWIGGARMNRSYSISSSPTQRDHIELTVRREPRGAVSRHINDLLKVGDHIEAGGPVGKFTFTGTEADSIVLIAGGVGITPMVSITRFLTERSWAGEIFFVYACRAPTDFIFANEVAALQRVNPKLRVAVTMSRPEGTDWKGPCGRVTKELLTQTVPNLASRRIHLCGPPSMMDSTKAILTELGVAPDQVKTELFGATKPTPAVAGTTAKPTAPATGPLVTFLKNNKSAKIHADQTVLELSEDLAIGIEYSCRVGTCGVCKAKMTSGEVAMAVEDALEPDDKANGIILACQAKPKGDVAVEA